MGDQQQNQINFSVPESLISETICFLEVPQHETVVKEEILRNSATSANLSKYSNTSTSLYNSPLGPSSNNL